jgi:SAM-dependent methyltransferase
LIAKHLRNDKEPLDKHSQRLDVSQTVETLAEFVVRGVSAMSEKPTSDRAPVESETSLAWVKPYYTQAGNYWGPTGIEQTHHDRLATMTRLCGPQPKRVLELGAGTGEAAAVMADAGHTVVAVEFSPTRAPHIQTLAQQPRQGSLIALEADFYDVSLAPEFDVVCYWDGFGIGSDADQRRLLRRIASEWLKPGGCALLDVFSPYRWTLETGQEWRLDRNHTSHRYRQRRRFDFDPVQGCFLDEWCPIDDENGTCDESRAIMQRIRCYSPADLQLLLEGTGLSLVHLEVDGKPLDFRSAGHNAQDALWKAWSYLVKLVVTP